VLDTYRTERQSGETFIATLRRVGIDPFKASANSARFPAPATAATTAA
jgi:sulfite reductase (NADPH) hemoprotein beta-component